MKFEGSDFHLRMTVRVKVFKLLCACGDRPECVEEIESIGSDALFLGEVESMCVSALDFLGCQPNCIYFTTSYWGIAEGPLDMAAFNLAPRRRETHYFSSSRLTKRMPSSVCILPTVGLKP
ncbi:PREDICTED: F-box [Prunus dulcis]|nr:PREDICTED: F-box [Prunus dulcis]